ncbi:Fic family protein [Butyricicoccus sp. Marseille-Q5471]|uniref:Fic family protein n=1 Tax=Butyricicoccus sp. Marseille-Q5471 TaxID=3039493 RepID=UPI0024BD36DD|nr:Fic family protein [Butyricicoccus sp. Marseille-Q5471]
MDFSAIDELLAELKGRRPLNQTELQRLRDEFIIEHTYDSNAIEGSTLTLRETALILQEGITIAEKPIKEHLEAIGYKDAFEYIVSLVDSNAPLSESVVKQIHSLVLMNDAANRGVYRSLPVRILGASHEPPQPYLVPVQMEALVAWYEEMKRQMHIIEAVAEFHLRFEGIHPFIDGNGRTGRLILNFELMKAGLLPVNIKFTDRRKYYDSFDRYYSDPPNAAPLVSLIASYEEQALRHRLEILR